MMADLIAHRDEEIRVRLQGDLRDIDFVLTDDVKNGIINIYNLYVAGGGTSVNVNEYLSHVTANI